MSRLTGLDALRAVAILLVLGHHPPGGEPSPGEAPFRFLWWRAGWVGVDLFFVLSGFLIGGLLFAEIKKTGTLRVRRFLVRRAFKIGPPYVVFLVAVALVLRVDGESLAPLLPNLIHLQNYFPLPPNHCWGHTWSLAVEEHFYLAMPALLLFLVRRDALGRLPVLFGAVAAGCLAARILTAALSPGHAPWVLYWPTHLRFDSLLAGILLAWLVAHSPGFVAFARRWRLALPPAAAVLCLPAVGAELYYSTFLGTVGFSLMWLASFCLVLWAWLAEDGPVLGSYPARWLAWVGASSYGIYLFHMPFALRAADALGCWADLSPTGLIAAYVVIAVVLGWLLTLAIERPALWLRNRVAA